MTNLAKFLSLRIRLLSIGEKMRCRKWIAVAGDLFDDTFEWEDGEGNFGRCLKVKSYRLQEKASRLFGKIVLIKAYYPKGYERSGELGVLVDIRESNRRRS